VLSTSLLNLGVIWRLSQTASSLVHNEHVTSPAAKLMAYTER